MTSDPVVPNGNGARVKPRVPFNAKSTGLQGLYGDAPIKLRAASLPVAGKINAEVAGSVARMTDAAPLGFGVVRGPSRRDKTVFVEDVGAGRVREVFRSRRR